MLIRGEIKPVALAILKLCLSVTKVSKQASAVEDSILIFIAFGWKGSLGLGCAKKRLPRCHKVKLILSWF